MKFLDVIKQLSIKNVNEFYDKIKKCVEKRIFWLEMREPESSGIVYETWEEKCEDLKEILEYIDDTKMPFDSEDVEELKDLVASYQIQYGGLSKLLI